MYLKSGSTLSSAFNSCAIQENCFQFPDGGLGNLNPARMIAHSPPGIKETLNYWLREKWNFVHILGYLRQKLCISIPVSGYLWNTIDSFGISWISMGCHDTRGIPSISTEFHGYLGPRPRPRPATLRFVELPLWDAAPP